MLEEMEMGNGAGSSEWGYRFTKALLFTLLCTKALLFSLLRVHHEGAI